METQKPKILPRLWTASEVDYLRSSYPSQLTTDVARYMGRTYASVSGKVQKLRLFKVCTMPWTASEIDYLRSSYPSQLTTDVARYMGRSYNSVKGKAKKLRLFKVCTMPWTASEIDYLRSSYPSQLTTDVARYMGRSYNSVKCKANKLRLSKFDDIDDSVKETIAIEVSNQIAQPKGIDLVRRESYVAPPWASFRASADDHLKYKSRGF